MTYFKNVRFMKHIYVSTMMFFGRLSSVNPLECVSMNNQEYKVRPEMVTILFYPFSIRTSKYSGTCNNINDPYAKMCVPDVVKNLNINVFNLLSKTNETRHIKWHETFKCNCRLDASACNYKQRCNENKCKCECKELIDNGLCDKELVWNPSNCECECDKSCDIGEYLNYKNCKCRKKLVHKLVEECIKTRLVEETRLVETSPEIKDKCNSCTVFRVLFWIFFIFFVINIGIGTYFTYCKYMNRGKENVPRYDYTC